jgi:hypothetical protein
LLWNSGNVVSKRGVVYLVDKDTEEGVGLIARVGLELRLGLGDECGGDGGKQTSLSF